MAITPFTAPSAGVTPIRGLASEGTSVEAVVDDLCLISSADDTLNTAHLAGMRGSLAGALNATKPADVLLTPDTAGKAARSTWDAGLVAKRALDILGALPGLMLCSLAYVIFGPIIRVQTGASVIFCQRRVGQNGEIFTMYKLRTMTADAETKLRDLLPHNEMRGCIFKMRNDPRITPIGRFLRRYHIDELPQFWNVLRGEMSLVGNRPPTPDEVAAYSPHHRRRLALKPGITGIWQISGNSAVWDFEEVVALDCEYIATRSLWLDLKLLFKTLSKIAKGDGW